MSNITVTFFVISKSHLIDLNNCLNVSDKATHSKQILSFERNSKEKLVSYFHQYIINFRFFQT